MDQKLLLSWVPTAFYTYFSFCTYHITLKLVLCLSGSPSWMRASQGQILCPQNMAQNHVCSRHYWKLGGWMKGEMFGNHWYPYSKMMTSMVILNKYMNMAKSIYPMFVYPKITLFCESWGCLQFIEPLPIDAWFLQSCSTRVLPTY